MGLSIVWVCDDGGMERRGLNRGMPTDVREDLVGFLVSQRSGETEAGSLNVLAEHSLGTWCWVEDVAAAEPDVGGQFT